ncbi:MAG: phosphoribosyltransferase family protein [Bacteroidota bacterium]
MEKDKTLLLTNKQIEQKLNRLAFQIYEDNSGAKEIVLAGIVKSGYEVAEKIAAILKSIAPFKILLTEVKFIKHGKLDQKIEISLSKEELNDKIVILVDDVMNSGKTMLSAMKPFLDAETKKLRTVVLVDRNHKRYPVSSDFVGLSLATTLQEHVSVEIESDKIEAWIQ